MCVKLPKFWKILPNVRKIWWKYRKFWKKLSGKKRRFVKFLKKLTKFYGKCKRIILINFLQNRKRNWGLRYFEKNLQKKVSIMWHNLNGKNVAKIQGILQKSGQ